VPPRGRWSASQEHGIEAVKVVRPLGSAYFPSPGVTAEAVFPMVAWGFAERPEQAQRRLLWVSLRELIAAHSAVRDGHLRVGMWRAAHALGILQL
jgi:hypothetical protein